MTPHSMLDHALGYADAGWPVFPLSPRTKRPATAHGKDDATTDAALIRQMFAGRDDYNVAIRPVPGVIVLDVDPRNGGDLDDLAPLTDTWAARTGGGGWHLLYRYQGPTVGRVRDTTGIDVKTDSGYIVAAPSIHPDGGRYEWINHHPLAPLPAHLHARVRRERIRPRTDRGRTAPGGLIAVVAEAQPGNRNNVLFWAACRLAEDNAPQQVWDDLRSSAQIAGLDDPEIDQTVASALDRTVVGK